MYKNFLFDVCLISGSGLLTFLLFSYYHVGEWFIHLAVAHEHYELDEMLFCLITMLSVACVMVFIRTRQTYRNIIMQNELRREFEVERKMYDEDLDEAVTLLLDVDKEIVKLREIFEYDLAAPLINIRHSLKKLIRDNDFERGLEQGESERIESSMEKLEYILNIASKSAHALEEKLHIALDSNPSPPPP